MAMASTTAFTVLFALATASSRTSSGSERVPVRVELAAPAGCATADDFFTALLARSERARRAAPGEDGTTFAVRLTRREGKVRGELRLVSGHGDVQSRTVEGARCDEVIKVLSLTAALAVDARAHAAPPPERAVATATPPAPAVTPSAAVAEAPRAPSPERSNRHETTAVPPAAAPPEPATTPSPPAPARVEAVAEVAAAAPASPRLLSVDIAAQALAGETIAASVGGAVAIRVRGARADGRGPSLGLGARYLSNHPLGGAAATTASFVAGTIAACPGWTLGRAMVVEPCAQAVIGALSVADHAVDVSHPARRFWGDVGAVARASRRLAQGLKLEAELGIAVPLVERRFMTTTPEESVGKTPPVNATVALGVAWTR